MKKGALAVLIVSIVLLIGGLLMIGCGVSDGPHTYYHHDGGSFYYYSVRYSADFGSGDDALTHFGHAVFNSGLVMMVIFAIMQIHDGHDRTLAEKERKADRIDAAKAKAEADDARTETVDPGCGKETNAPDGN